MQGFFSEEALGQCETLLASTYDYTRCVRPNGSTYGTAGQCRKGVEISRVETGVFTVTDADGQTVGSIRTETGGGAVTTRNGRSTARYTASVTGKGEKQGLTLAQSKAWVKDQLGEKTGGEAKIAIKGGLTEKGKKRRLANLDSEIEEVRTEANARIKEWNATPKEQRRNNSGLQRKIEHLKAQYEALTAKRKMIKAIPTTEFSEEGVEDFTRCVRPNGSSYGTGGKCRKGVEQELFEPDSGIPTGASGGRIAGRLFKVTAPIKIETTSPTQTKPEVGKKDQPYKTLYGDLKQSIEDSKKRGFARNKKKVDALLKNANTLLKRELEMIRKGHRDNAYSDLYEGLNKALEKVIVHGDKSDLRRSHDAQAYRQELLEFGYDSVLIERRSAL